MRSHLFALVLLPCLAAGPASRDGERPISLPEAKATGSLQSISELADLPVINADSIDRILKLSLKDKDLVLDTAIAPTEQSRVVIPNFAGISHVKLLGADEPGSPLVIVQYDFENRDYTVPRAICRYTNASLVAGTLTLGQMFETLDDQVYTVQLLQNTVAPGEETPRVSLYVQITTEPEVKLTMTADNVVELRRKYPAEVAKYVDPIFRALRQEALLSTVNPRLAWQVFAASFAPAPALVKQVDGLIAQLDAKDFKDREAASRQLETLGQPAALILMRRPRTGLSDEQSTRIDALVAKFKTVSDDEAAGLRSDRDFLLDCLSSSEQAIRAQALKELRRVTGKPIEFDVDADAAKCEAAISKLRETIGSPTTRQLKD